MITGSITVEAGFNRNGLMAWQEDDNNHRTIYGHNARDEMTRIDCADSSFKTMMRDLCGNPYFVTDQNGSQVTTVYNDVDLPVSRSIVRAAGVGGPTVEGYGWDAARRCIQAWNNDTDVTQAFDSLGNCDLEGQTIPAFGTPKSVAKTFDPSSNKLTINDGTATTQYTIDACHRRSGVAVDAFPIAAYQFAGPGLRSPSLGYWNGTQMAATSDGFGREETRAWTSGPDTISSFINQYNDRHERTRETWSHYAGYYTDVTLDSVGRTIASKFKTDPVSGIPAEDCTYDLDGVCNREIVTTNGTPVTYIANQINSYTSIGGVTRVHDANGNLTDDGTQLYTFNYRNELIGAYRKSDNFMLGTYTNDAFGRRVLREYWDAAAGGYKTLRYVYDSWQIAAEYLWDGEAETFFARIHYGNGIDEPLAMLILDVNDVNGNFITNEYLPYAFHRDTLGTITHLTDESGEIVERYECTPFGKTTIYTGTGPDGVWNTADDQMMPFSRVENNLIFQARERDAESGLYRFGPRCYSSEHGRFLQRDSEGDFSVRGSLGNGYNYCTPGLAGVDFALRLDDIIRAVGKKLKEAKEKVREWILALIDREPDKSEEELRKERRRLVRDHFRRLYWKAAKYWGSRWDWRGRFWQAGKDALKGEGPHFNDEHTDEEWDQKKKQWDDEDRNREDEDAGKYLGALERWAKAADTWKGSTEDFSEAMKKETKEMDERWSEGPEHDFWGGPK